MAPTSRILCVGAAHWDTIGRSAVPLGISDDAPGAIERRLGGVALNIAVGLAQHGCPTSLCSVVGDDAAGAALIRDLGVIGIDCSAVTGIAGSATGHYVAVEDDRGNLFVAIADAALLEEHGDAVAMQAGVAVQDADTVLLDANLTMPVIQQIALSAKDAGAEIVANPVSPAKAPRLEVLLSWDLAPTIVANLAEVNAVLRAGFDDAVDAAKALQTRSGGTALVTDGPRPVVLATPHEVHTAMPPVLSGNTSATGAGDALLAAFVAFRGRQSTLLKALEAALEAAIEHMSKQR